ncbi:hypothetical protein RBB50_000686 [Rhinocladiella similis]
MPPRKSTSSTTAPGETNGDVSMVSNASTTHAHPTAASHSKSSRQSGGHKQQDDGVSIDDLLLPRSLVSRLARGVLPPNTSIQKDATLALAKSATVFISYLAHHANEQTTKKTVSPQDVIKALEQIEMGGVMGLGAVGQDGRLGGRLERELEAYEEHIKGKRKGYRDKVKARESVGDDQQQQQQHDQTGDATAAEAAERGEPSTKKARRMSEDDDDDDDQRMLEAQLNGGNAVDANGDDEDDQDEEEEVDEEEENDDEEEDDDDDDDEEEQGEDEERENDADELEGSRHDRRNNSDGRRIGLMPDGNVDMSGEESD